jgi:hypothetical protein
MHRFSTFLLTMMFAAGAVQAGTFRLYDLTPEQGCECDCFTGLSRAEARPDKDGRQPLLVAFYGNGADIRIDGAPLRLLATDVKTKTGWYVFKDEQSQTTLTPNLLDKGVDKNGDTIYAGEIKVTQKGATLNIKVTGFDTCAQGAA